MPEPGSHQFDIHRTRRRGFYEREHVPSVPDQHADEAARADVERDNPPHRLPPRERAGGPAGATRPPGSQRADGLRVRSPAFNDHDFLPERHARAGEDVAPPLEWDDVPDGTAELALLCEDLDAPGGPFIHWVVAGIPADAHEIGERLPRGAREGRNGFGEPGWGGPHPPVGDEPHRYAFRLVALDEHAKLPDPPRADDLRTAVREHGIAGGTLIGLYAR